ncbi:MAG TPA: carboxylesterase, partial [Candidatus Pelethenecus sp.]|nr:carboxylesterase [Candidatus Pelethenecus sp.]
MRGLICIHGLLSSKADFIRIEPSLRNLYDWIETSDLPGHGMNQLKFNTQNVKDYILNIYDRMAVKCDEIDVIGYSMGGVIACYLQSVRYV